MQYLCELLMFATFLNNHAKAAYKGGFLIFAMCRLH
jgi:hypothetical protein